MVVMESSLGITTQRRVFAYKTGTVLHAKLYQFNTLKSVLQRRTCVLVKNTLISVLIYKQRV